VKGVKSWVFCLEGEIIEGIKNESQVYLALRMLSMGILASMLRKHRLGVDSVLVLNS
jgi:hypothetical protein